MNIVRFLITWAPTFLFIFSVLIGTLIGCIRGFRKSLILFIHMLIAFAISLITYLCIVNNPNLDKNMVDFINTFLKMGNTSLQQIFEVDPKYTTLHEMLTIYFTKDMDPSFNFYIIYENMAYIAGVVNLVYHMIIAVLCCILYSLIIFILYIIYLIFYPVRRKIKKQEKKFQQGEVNHAYKRRRWAGSLIGAGRSIITGIVGFSFLGALLFVISGGVTPPQRNEIKEDNVVEFSNDTFNQVYDYYSYVCEMGDTGIFQVLNSIKDTSNTPLYFYFADLVLQGKIQDENLGVDEKFYLRSEIGEYTNFINCTMNLILKYSDVQVIDEVFSENNEENMKELMQIFSNEEFVNEFSLLIDEFKGSTFITNLCLSSLTSLVNHIDEVVPNEDVIGLVNQIFKSEDSVKVTDLATEQDVKGLFKGVIQLVASADLEKLSKGTDQSVTPEEKLEMQKEIILLARDFIPVVQNLSLFSTRADVGDRIIQGIYTYCSENLIQEPSDETTDETNQNIASMIEIPEDLDWIKEFNILLDSCKPLLTIYYNVAAINTDETMNNILNMFENATVEEAYDQLTEKLVTSQLLDVVFKSSFIGKQIDSLIVSIAQNEEAKIPKNIDYVGQDGECAILLDAFKVLLKNGGGPVISSMMKNSKDISSEQIKEMVDVFTKEVNYKNEQSSVINILIQSKLLHYTLSSYLTYAKFGTFKLYLPESATEMVEEIKIIKHDEIKVIIDLISNCTDLISDIMDNPENIDYAKILSNEYIQKTTKESVLLQGTLANVIIGLSSEHQQIVLPEGFDDPEMWLSTDTSDGEIITLLNAVFDLSGIVVDDKYLINELLNGSIAPKTLLDLDDATIQDICLSTVLRYTVSDLVTDLGTDGFKIVVAYASLEKVNASTTSEKTVNVIKADELSDIFVEIKKIIKFDENDQNNIKINYNAVFKNKAELSKNKTVAATVIQAIFDNNKDDFLVIPQNYIADFEKIKTQADLENNAWFGKTGITTDDELYLALNAMETLLDKDEEGNIASDFDFSTIQNDLKLREGGIDVICESAIFNATISAKLVEQFYVPESSFANELIVKEDLDALFNAVFKMFNKTELTIVELNDNLFDVSFEKNKIDTILNSKILVATISQRMKNIETIYIPATETTETTYVQRDEEGFIVNKIELKNLFLAMFEVLGMDSVMVNDLTQHLEDIAITSTSIPLLVESSILRTTISEKITQVDHLTILSEDVIAEEVVNQNIVNVIVKDELSKLMNSIFTLIESDRLVVSNINQQLTNLVLNKEDVSKLLDSNILNSTISSKISESKELVVPTSVTKEKQTIASTSKQIINKDELSSFIDAVFILLETNALEMNNLNTNLQSFNLTKEKANKALESVVLQCTISSNFVSTNELTIPSIVLKEIETIDGISKTTIAEQELKAFFDALFATTTSISGTDFDLTQMHLPTDKPDADTMVKSLIVAATLSNSIHKDESIIKIIDELMVPYELEGIPTENKYVEQNELSNLLLALTNGLGMSDPNHLVFDDVKLPKTDAQKQALVSSVILRATISEKILNQNDVHISQSSQKLDISKHISNASVGILSSEEILNVIRGIELLNPNNDNFDNLNLDVGVILGMDNAAEVLTAIANSDVYTCILSHTLGKETTISGNTYQAYQLFTTDLPSRTIEGSIYTYAVSSLIPTRFVIQYPSTLANVYTSFNLAKGAATILNRADVLALQYATQTP